MNRTWLAAALLLALCVAGALTAARLNTFADKMEDELLGTLTLAEAGEWPEAQALLQTALSRWDRSRTCLSLVLHHIELDELGEALMGLESKVGRQSTDDLREDTERLLWGLRHFISREALTWANVV